MNHSHSERASRPAADAPPAAARAVAVFCVDDNQMLAEAIQRRLALESDFRWSGWAGGFDTAVQAVLAAEPDVVLLDIDMPAGGGGGDSFDLVQRLGEVAPSARVVMFSGHVRGEYIDKAVDSGAWGYLSKNESLEEVLDAIRRVAAGEFVTTSEVRQEQLRQP